MNRDRLLRLLEELPRARALVVGDLFLDEYLEIDQGLHETSLETGLQAHQVRVVRSAPGGAGTVVKDLCALGCAVSVIGVVGDDGRGLDLVRGLVRAGAQTAGVVVQPGGLTNAYLKPVIRESSKGLRELERLDIKNRQQLPPVVAEEVCENLRDARSWASVIVVSEYVGMAEGGMITDAVVKVVSEIGGRWPEKPIVVDLRHRRLPIRHAIAKCNAREAARLARIVVSEEAGDDVLARLGKTLVRLTGRPAFVTLGARGLLVADLSGCRLARAIPVEGPVDVVGAGDATSAAIGAALGVGATCDEAAVLGNLAASVAISMIGETGTPTPMDIAGRARDEQSCIVVRG